MWSQSICIIVLTLVLWLYLIVRFHKRSIEQIRQQTALAESLLQAAPAAMAVLDHAGHIRQFNKAAGQLFGMASRRALGRQLSELVRSPAEGKPSHLVREVLQQLAQSGAVYQCHGLCDDGSSFAMQLRARSVEHEGQRWVIVNLDDLTSQNDVKAALSRHVSQLQLTKETLQRQNSDLEAVICKRTAELSVTKEAAERANAAKSDFLANMSHELRTPLHAILSFARFGTKRSASVERAKLLTYFERIESSGQTLLKLLNQLLDLSKLEAGGMTLHCESVDLASLLNEVADEFAELAREKSLTLRVPHSASGTLVWGDHDKLAQVLRNLMGNSIKFSPEGGLIEWALSQDESTAVMSIRDDGPGIPDEECEAVFDKFVQSKRTRTGAGGTGLGLAISREIVKLHEGRIYAEPTQGNGALIRVCLPLWTPAEPAGELCVGALAG